MSSGNLTAMRCMSRWREIQLNMFFRFCLLVGLRLTVVVGRGRRGWYCSCCQCGCGCNGSVCNTELMLLKK